MAKKVHPKAGSGKKGLCMSRTVLREQGQAAAPAMSSSAAPPARFRGNGQLERFAGAGCRAAGRTGSGGKAGGRRRAQQKTRGPPGPAQAREPDRSHDPGQASTSITEGVGGIAVWLKDEPEPLPEARMALA